MKTNEQTLTIINENCTYELVNPLQSADILNPLVNQTDKRVYKIFPVIEVTSKGVDIPWHIWT